AAERFTGVGKRVLNHVLLFTARGHRDLDLAANLRTQRLSEERAIDDFMRNQDQPRWWLVVVKLGEEGGQDFADRKRAVRFRKVSAIAPVLTGAEEEHLHAAESALLMNRKNVGLLNAARI